MLILFSSCKDEIRKLEVSYSESFYPDLYIEINKNKIIYKKDEHYYHYENKKKKYVLDSTQIFFEKVFLIEPEKINSLFEKIPLEYNHIEDKNGLDGGVLGFKICKGKDTISEFHWELERTKESENHFKVFDVISDFTFENIEDYEVKNYLSFLERNSTLRYEKINNSSEFEEYKFYVITKDKVKEFLEFISKLDRSKPTFIFLENISFEDNFDFLLINSFQKNVFYISDLNLNKEKENFLFEKTLLSKFESKRDSLKNIKTSNLSDEKRRIFFDKKIEVDRKLNHLKRFKEKYEKNKQIYDAFVNEEYSIFFKTKEEALKYIKIKK